MENKFKTFTNSKFGEIRTLNLGGNAWFVGKDVAEVLGYAKPQNALATHVDEEDKTTALIQGTGSNYKSQTVLINESGLYSLILSSKLPQAKDFKHWVTSEVLPQIRQTGGYIPIDNVDDEKTILCKAVEILMKTVEYMKPKAEYAEDVLLSPSCYTMTQVAKSLSMTVQELQDYLRNMHIIYRSPSGTWMLYAEHLKKGYEAYRTKKGENLFGDVIWTNTYLVWTERGKEFIHNLMNKMAA